MFFDVPWNVLALQLFFGLALGAVYVLLASGLSIIYGLLDVVNFAHGTFAMLGAYAVYLAVSLSGNFWVGIVSAIVIIGLIGGMVEWIFLKPLYGKDPLLPLLLTFGMSVAVPDLIKIIFGLIGKPVNYPESLGGATLVGPLILPNYRLFIILFTLAIMISLWIFLKKSDLGMIIRASTRDSLMVQVLGVNVSRIWTIGFAIGIGLAALAGAWEERSWAGSSSAWWWPSPPSLPASMRRSPCIFAWPSSFWCGRGASLARSGESRWKEAKAIPGPFGPC